MQMKRISKALSFILCIVLIAAMALFTVGCTSTTQSSAPAASEASGVPYADGTVLGEGSTVFPFVVVDKDGNETKLEIHTDKTIVGEALMEAGVLEGEEGQYGLYVKKVNGISADYDKDGVYWAFYINGEYGMTGVDMTEIEADTTYTFKVEQ